MSATSRSSGWLDWQQPPLARITERRLIAYARALHAAGNADHTLIGRFAELASAMRIMTGRKQGWIRKPGGMAVYAALAKTRKVKLPPNSQVLYHWGISLMETAALASGDRAALVAYRDGLILALLAARGRRLAAMANLCLTHLDMTDPAISWIDLPASLVKTNRRDRFPVPEALMSYLRHYLAVVRPRLLRGAYDEALWIGIWLWLRSTHPNWQQPLPVPAPLTAPARPPRRQRDRHHPRHRGRFLATASADSADLTTTPTSNPPVGGFGVPTPRLEGSCVSERKTHREGRPDASMLRSVGRLAFFAAIHA